jgi:hypothetical protein
VAALIVEPPMCRAVGTPKGGATMAQDDVPEFYIDQFRVTCSAVGSAMTFGLNPPHPSPGQSEMARDTVRIRMSLEHAKIMAMLLRRQLKSYEEQFALEIPLPRQVYNNLGLSQEDW